jgi:hypothetical protein
VSFNQQVTDAFKQVLDKMEANTTLSVEEKEETKQNLKIFSLGNLSRAYSTLFLSKLIFKIRKKKENCSKV